MVNTGNSILTINDFSVVRFVKQVYVCKTSLLLTDICIERDSGGESIRFTRTAQHVPWLDDNEMNGDDSYASTEAHSTACRTRHFLIPIECNAGVITFEKGIVDGGSEP